MCTWFWLPGDISVKSRVMFLLIIKVFLLFLSNYMSDDDRAVAWIHSSLDLNLLSRFLVSRVLKVSNYTISYLISITRKNKMQNY